jgi:hypothetical protein
MRLRWTLNTLATLCAIPMALIHAVMSALAGRIKVYVHYWPKTQSERELWLGYLTSASYAQSKSLFGTFFVCAETRSKAITEAIRRAKESQEALAGRKGASE